MIDTLDGGAELVSPGSAVDFGRFRLDAPSAPSAFLFDDGGCSTGGLSFSASRSRRS